MRFQARAPALTALPVSHEPRLVSSILIFLISLLFFGQCISANVEKVVFKAPPRIDLSHSHPNVEDLYLMRLSPFRSGLRTQLRASFTSEAAPKGIETWLLLEGLNVGQRYEIRICYLATQPTEFTLHIHPFTTVLEAPRLLRSLAAFSEGILESVSAETSASEPDPVKTSSILFLQVFASADYFSTNESLMRDVPPVDVDIILDPFLLNIFPESLVPTAFYIIIIAILAFVLSGFISDFLHAVGRQEGSPRPASAPTDSLPSERKKDN